MQLGTWECPSAQQQHLLYQRPLRKGRGAGRSCCFPSPGHCGLSTEVWPHSAGKSCKYCWETAYEIRQRLIAAKSTAQERHIMGRDNSILSSEKKNKNANLWPWNSNVTLWWWNQDLETVSARKVWLSLSSFMYIKGNSQVTSQVIETCLQKQKN